MIVLHIIAEIAVFFSAICIIYYFFQITQGLGNKRQNYIYCLSAVIVLLLAAPVANLSRQKTVSPTDQVSNQVRKVQKKHQSQRESQKKQESQSSNRSGNE
ncbi:MULTISPECIES: hypothetical protein [Lactobacillaceae]|uniref:hypothetical protein n=1 Tax=Lactobacillaceae TaxID=33958 RepID=UPI00145674FC|nr:hypothetical protein [Lactobacillus sp. HBUAS51381]NLR10146.1 hypothetical protein [Lactobacillus sp. HBUAS51381]